VYVRRAVGALAEVALYTLVIADTCGGEGAPDSMVYNNGASASLGGLGRMDEEGLMVNTTSHGTLTTLTHESEEMAVVIDKRCTPWMAVDPVFLGAAGGGRGKVEMVDGSESSCSESESEIGSVSDGEGRRNGNGNGNGKGKERADSGAKYCPRGMRKLGDGINRHSTDHGRGSSNDESGCTSHLGQGCD
jgi:hypothetical protein